MSSGSRLPRGTIKSSWPEPASSSTIARPIKRVPPRTMTLNAGVCLRPSGDCYVRILLHDQVDQAPLLGLFGVHEEVALHRALDIFERPAGVLRVDAGHRLALAQDLPCRQPDVAGPAPAAL